MKVTIEISEDKSVQEIQTPSSPNNPSAIKVDAGTAGLDSAATDITFGTNGSTESSNAGNPSVEVFKWMESLGAQNSDGKLDAIDMGGAPVGS
ncbi:MAG: hypothetical protein IPO07_07095 [Haliscomenobacter sp.]|nr:hypothetical protein [Haliscomenobacter sp.]MBK9488567.1 hypothetical protein [Haliscomenobacter sp.]